MVLSCKRQRNPSGWCIDVACLWSRLLNQNLSPALAVNAPLAYLHFIVYSLPTPYRSLLCSHYSLICADFAKQKSCGWLDEGKMESQKRFIFLTFYFKSQPMLRKRETEDVNTAFIMFFTVFSPSLSGCLFPVRKVYHYLVIRPEIQAKVKRRLTVFSLTFSSCSGAPFQKVVCKITQGFVAAKDYPSFEMCRYKYYAECPLICFSENPKLAHT